ncbi:hypothetical protein [Winogradskyella flava]|uniref:Surface antigen n=1 Tax=Winogradskyella flava TaxID=1884876 RepID=A0A842IQB7_9FLAO|nr:hypothetical protein [Winogradskyella flava]MBC2844905.1 hypothetical protein [Winogradskyella flava]
MKTIRLSLLVIAVSLVSFAQDGPRLQVTGNGAFIQRGTIDTELLTALIQQKQEEVKQRVFRNTIIRQFNHSSYTKRLNNFTTYSYLYSLMDVLTSGKNKTVMTKQIVERSAEFAAVYGIILLANSSLNESAKVQFTPGDRGAMIPMESVKDFNIRIDMCLDILLKNESTLLEKFKFKETLSNNKYYQSWYINDNTYLKALESNDGADADFWMNERRILKDKIDKFIEYYEAIENVAEIIGNNYALKTELKTIKDGFFEGSQEDFSDVLAEIEERLATTIPDDLKQDLLNIKSYLDDKTEVFGQLYNFYKDLEKSRFKDFTMTKAQYNAMKYILLEFIDLARNQYVNNDVISSILEFMLEYTSIEYTTDNGISMLEEQAEAQPRNAKGYLYLDVPSLITAIDANLGSVKRKGILNYVTPFFSIGTNYASFDNDNALMVDGEEINDLYFASEKLGLKWKVWNWKYTHSFEAGETFNYYGYKKRKWNRPQQEPLLSDLYVMAYGSGLLYNLVDLKSQDGFDYAVFGAGVGITFFNGLSLNVSYASPLVDKQLDNGFFNVGFDIPIIDYISALSKKGS